MKKGLLLLLSFVLVFPLFFGFVDVGEADAKTVKVKGYYRKDGTYVRPHTRNYGGSSSSGSSSDYNYNYSIPSYPMPTLSTSEIVNLYKGNKLAGEAYVDELVYVEGYYREDGTYVRPHYKTHPNKYERDNFSYLGLSTLLPLSEKYPSFKYSSDDNVAAIQHYLYTSTIHDSLSSYGLTYLTSYAEKLDNNDSLTGLYGGMFYQHAGYDYNFANALVKFDKSGILTPELYLYQVLKALGVKTVTYNQQSNLLSYANMLKDQSFKTETEVKEAGREFYKSIGLKTDDIEAQIELDLLQDF